MEDSWREDRRGGPIPWAYYNGFIYGADMGIDTMEVTHPLRARPYLLYHGSIPVMGASPRVTCVHFGKKSGALYDGWHPYLRSEGGWCPY